MLAPWLPSFFSALFCTPPFLTSFPASCFDRFFCRVLLRIKGSISLAQKKHKKRNRANFATHRLTGYWALLSRLIIKTRSAPQMLATNAAASIYEWKIGKWLLLRCALPWCVPGGQFDSCVFYVKIKNVSWHRKLNTTFGKVTPSYIKDKFGP